jgi:hypothetical protein
MPHLSLRFESFVVRVAASDRRDLDWLAAFLACGFEQVEPPAPGGEVALTIDALAHDRLLARGPAGSGPDLEGFAGDSPRPGLQPWTSEADSWTLRDRRFPAFYRLWRSRRAVEMIAREGGRRCRRRLMRIVRELAMDHALASGGVLIHGAAVSTHRGVVVISGPKGSGKTTLLTSLLASTDVAYVSNDRCLLRTGAGGATVRGLPTLVSISRTGLEALPQARERLLHLRPDLAAAEGPAVSLDPPEMLALLGARSASDGPAGAFLFPAVTSRPQRLALRRLSRAEALDGLRAGLFRADRAAVLGEVFASEATRGRAPWPAAEPAARWVSENLPCFRVELGGGGPPLDGECRALLQAVVTQMSRSPGG